MARCPVATDGRGVAAELTDGGRRPAAGGVAHPPRPGWSRHFADRLDAEDLTALERISRRLVD